MHNMLYNILRKFGEVEHGRVNLQKTTEKWFLYIGLMVEGIALWLLLTDYLETYPKADLDPNRRIALEWYWHVGLVLLLIALLIHQTFIRNSFEAVEKMTVKATEVDNSFFPVKALNSYFEFWIRLVIYVVIALVSGELAYILLVIAIESHTNTYMDHLRTIFIIATFSLCFVVLVWDVIIIFYHRQDGKRLAPGRLFPKDKEERTDDMVSRKVLNFLISDILALFIWASLLVYVLNPSNRTPLFLVGGVSLVYFFFITGRLLSSNRGKSPDLTKKF